MAKLLHPDKHGSSDFAKVKFQQLQTTVGFLAANFNNRAQLMNSKNAFREQPQTNHSYHYKNQPRRESQSKESNGHAKHEQASGFGNSKETVGARIVSTAGELMAILRRHKVKTYLTATALVVVFLTNSQAHPPTASVHYSHVITLDSRFSTALECTEAQGIGIFEKSTEESNPAEGSNCGEGRWKFLGDAGGYELYEIAAKSKKDCDCVLAERMWKPRIRLIAEIKKTRPTFFNEYESNISAARTYGELKSIYSNVGPE